MGFIQSLIDEIAPFPKHAKEIEVLSNHVIRYKVSFAYALLNCCFQCIDCIVVPLVLLIIFKMHLFIVLKYLLIAVFSFSSIFSIYQFLRYLIVPVDNYLSLKDRLLGETAIGHLFAAILGVRISYSTKSN
jgi:hypothetical protein